MDADLLRKEVKEDVDMSTHGCMMNVGVVLSILFVAVGAKLDECLDAVVCSVLDGKCHQLMSVAIELFVKKIEACETFAIVQEAQNVYVVLHHSVVNRQELPYLFQRDWVTDR